jgi:hypothetical protein
MSLSIETEGFNLLIYPSRVLSHACARYLCLGCSLFRRFTSALLFGALLCFSVIFLWLGFDEEKFRPDFPAWRPRFPPYISFLYLFGPDVRCLQGGALKEMRTALWVVFRPRLSRGFGGGAFLLVLLLC